MNVGRRRKAPRALAAAAVLIAAVVAAGCGGSDNGDNAATEWAGDLCSAVSTWTGALSSAAQTLQEEGLSETGVTNAVDTVKSATTTFVNDVERIGKPDIDAGQQAEDALQQLRTSLETELQTIESTVENASGVSEVLAAVTTVTTALTTMGSEVSSAVQNLEDVDAGGELESAFRDASECDDLRSGS